MRCDHCEEREAKWTVLGLRYGPRDDSVFMHWCVECQPDMEESSDCRLVDGTVLILVEAE